MKVRFRRDLRYRLQRIISREIETGREVGDGFAACFSPQANRHVALVFGGGLFRFTDCRIDCFEFLLLRFGGEVVLIPVLDGSGIGFAKTLRVLKDRSERVVIRMKNGIEFVIVASRTPERQTHERFAGRVELLVDYVHDELLPIRLGEDAGTEGEESCRDQ